MWGSSLSLLACFLGDPGCETLKSSAYVSSCSSDSSSFAGVRRLTLSMLFEFLVSPTILCCGEKVSLFLILLLTNLVINPIVLFVQPRADFIKLP